MLGKVAQKIATSISDILGYGIIITNQYGIIIGASDKRRLNSLHEASLYVIKNNKPLSPKPGYIDHFKGTKPGITLPIELLGEIIGTIAVAGDRKKVEKLGHLVKKHAEILIREEIYIESRVLSQQAMQYFVQEILMLDSNVNNESVIRTRCYELGISLKPPFICIVIDLISFKEETGQSDNSSIHIASPELELQSLKVIVLEEIKSIFNLQGDLSTYIGRDKIFVLHSTNSTNSEKTYENIVNQCTILLERLATREVEAIFGVGTIGKRFLDIKSSYEEACKVVNIGKKRVNSEKVLLAKDFLIEILLLNLNKGILRMIEREIKPIIKRNDWKEISETIKAWCESGFNKVSTAEAMFIHRNTLQYRLERIEETLKVDVKDYRKMLHLYLGILANELDVLDDEI